MGFEKLPKVQKNAQSGHTEHKQQQVFLTLCDVNSTEAAKHFEHITYCS